ncbi:uncharacterized protein LOC126887146 [Diabrotica virgifera virgifera]|uniref:Uncharacterized protein n=1 Tax=Diabrotica virgifera virgifera TaxID=50390 RepID=A0ABM5KJT1_DIAVI|nr:uncharacterized protein LOC126887146 [Diabrotica virgifera virgifera]
MVVPVERKVGRVLEKPKQFVGNNLTLNIDENKSSICLTGNNCKVTLAENNGKLQVVGDNCEIVVRKGNGNIKYVGNCGKIVLGLGVSSENVNYIGNRGNVTSVNPNGSSELQDISFGVSESNHRRNTNKFVKDGTRNLTVRNANMIQVTSSAVPKNFELPLPFVRLPGNLLRR